MASITARRTAGATADTRTAGGKITRNRRPPPSSRTPYARPTPTPEGDEEETENPNWLSNLIYPAKVIGSGVGKIFSFFGNDYSSSSEDDSENDADDELDEVENDGSDKVLSSSSKINKKRKIEQLVMAETFSREEGKQLIHLIKSRTVDANGSLGVRTPPARTTAIMEAKKWLQEKRSGSKKKQEVELDLTSSQLTRSGKGSPADVAKSYMQNRPAWTSPSVKKFDLGSSSTMGVLNFKEETPKLTVRRSELKRSSFASGSWNLLEEIRKVRSKATEELLAASPLTETSFSLFSPKSDPPCDILDSKGDVEGAGLSESTHIRTENVLPDAGAISSLIDNQDGDAVQSVELQEHLEATDPKSNKDLDVNELRNPTEVNGSTDNHSNLPGGTVEGQCAAEEPRQSKGENGNLVNPIQVEQDIHVDKSNPVAEPADAPSTNPTDIVVNGSQNSSSMQEEDLSPELSQPIVGGPTTRAMDMAKERKSRGYARRGRGRGK